MRRSWAYLCLLSAALNLSAAGQEAEKIPQKSVTSKPSASGQTDPNFAERPLSKTAPAPAASGPYVVAPGTRILLSMINSVSTKQAAIGDRIYLETAFPVVTKGKIVIPQGSWVTGTITSVKRPGRAKGKGELEVHFDSLVLPNGVSRDFNGDLAALDSRSDEKLRREDSKITGPGNKGGDVGTVIGSATSGTVIGSGAGALAGSVARGAGIGGAAGAAAGLIGTLLTRGPDATLTRGSTVEMVLDRPLSFSDEEVDDRYAAPRRPVGENSYRPEQKPKSWISSRPPL